MALPQTYAALIALGIHTDYSMGYGTHLGFRAGTSRSFYWYQLDSYVKTGDEKENVLVTQEELGSVFEILNHVATILPNKKILAWCGTINMARFWKSEIEKYYKQRQNLKNFKFGLDTSADSNDDYSFFSKITRDNNDNIIKFNDLNDSDKRKMYYGTGMEGLKYDDEGTPKYEKFVKRNEELNKPSKDYYLDKDEVDDSYDRIMKDGKVYKKHKYVLNDCLCYSNVVLLN